MILFLYPALTLGFLFVGVPLLVHLINMLRHRRQRWAAMDFLLASYRKQRKWIHLRQILLLLSRLMIAFLLIAMLCGWSGGRQLLDALGGTVTHHVIILDDSYSMGDQSEDGREASETQSDPQAVGDLGRTRAGTAYGRALTTLQDLTRYLANQDGEHQLTVMRASRAAMSIRAGNESGDSAADLSSQTIGEDARLINRLMATAVSPLEVDLIPAIDLATGLLRSTPADEKYFYILSDFREARWGAADRIAESLRVIGDDLPLRLVDCAAETKGNLSITSLTPSPDVWVAGVPVVVRVTVKNFGTKEVKNVPVMTRVIRYPDERIQADPASAFSGEVESLPELMIDALGAGEEITKTFQVYIAEEGTHAVMAELPSDALQIDNQRFCTLPLSGSERVLVIDGDLDGRGAYHVSSTLNPGSQVEIGAIPEIQPPSFLRSITFETLSAYRAVYLIDLPDISDNAAAALSEYVQRGGGLAWFLGPNVNAASYNKSLLDGNRQLLPASLGLSSVLSSQATGGTGDAVFVKDSDLFGPLKSAGDGVLSLVAVEESWELGSHSGKGGTDTGAEVVADYRVALERRDGKPLILQHNFGEGRVLTSLIGLDGRWTNWPGDPTFVVFLLQSNAWLWSAASPSVARGVEEDYFKQFSQEQFLKQATFLPPAVAPPRVPFEVIGADNTGDGEDGSGEQYVFAMSPSEMLIRGDEHLEDVLQPGLAEWGLVAVDGSTRVMPQATVIDSGDGDLLRADHGSVIQQLDPLNVRFVERRSWNQQELASGSSMMTLLLLCCLVLFLALEQLLGYWASYHVTSATKPATGQSHLRRPSGLRSEKSSTQDEKSFDQDSVLNAASGGRS